MIFRSKGICNLGCACARALKTLERRRRPYRSEDNVLPFDQPENDAFVDDGPDWTTCCTVYRNRDTRDRRRERR